jgi:D-alanyl-D-alanine dipeptidase
MPKRPWSDFADVRSQSFVRGLVSEARDVSPDELVEVVDYRKDERIKSCGGNDPLRALVAYAHDELIYDEQDNVVSAPALCRTLPRERRVNKFGLAYRRDAKFYLNKILADIVIGAAVHLYKTQGWTTVLYDGLRTVEGAFNLYCFASDDDIANGLLALPGQSAHNKGLAVDSMMIDAQGKEVDMGGHFDHLDMATNSRIYAGDKISAAAKKNRMIREAAFLHSAFSQDRLVAPLRTEFWDDRLPENREDLWRVLDSAARCLGLSLLSPEDEKLRKSNRTAFKEKWESWNYVIFLEQWQKTFGGRESDLQKILGVHMPPPEEKAEFYHGNYHPIYDRRLRASGKHLTDPPAAP